MNGYTDRQFCTSNLNTAIIALHWLPQWYQFEARLYHKTGNGMIELGKFVDDSLYGARKMALNSIGGYSGIIPKDETQVS